MPCLNEAETLEECLRKARHFLVRTGISSEVVVADNGSTDGSREIARRCGARVVEVPVHGYGAALSAAGRLFFRCPVGDLHYGLRGYSREAFQRMDLHTTGMEFVHKDGRSRPSHLRPWRDGWRHLRFMLLYSLLR